MNDFNKVYGGTLYYDGKEDNSYGSNKIYIVAGERNIKSANTLGGLYANVGQTTRRIIDRLNDDDYKRKAAGGRWISLFEHSVGNSISDKDIHIHLKQHPFVKWDRDSNNTEEFLFCNDLGDGAVAKEIVLGILKKISIPMMQEENTILVNKNASIVKELNEANEKIKEMLSTDYIHNLVTKVNKLESKLISDKVVLSELRGVIEMREGTIRRNGERIKHQVDDLAEKNIAVSELEKKVNNAENNAFNLKAGAICSICALCIFSLYFAYTLYVISDKYEETIHNLENEVKSLKIMNEGAAKYIEESKKQDHIVNEEERNIPTNNGSLSQQEQDLVRKYFNLPAGQDVSDYVSLLGDDGVQSIVKPSSVGNKTQTEQTIDCVSIGEGTDHNWHGQSRGPWYTDCKTQSEVLRLYGEAFNGPSPGTKVKISKLGNNYIAAFGGREIAVVITDGSGNSKKPF